MANFNATSAKKTLAELDREMTSMCVNKPLDGSVPPSLRYRYDMHQVLLPAGIPGILAQLYYQAIKYQPQEKLDEFCANYLEMLLDLRTRMYLESETDLNDDDVVVNDMVVDSIFTVEPQEGYTNATKNKDERKQKGNDETNTVNKIAEQEEKTSHWLTEQVIDAAKITLEKEWDLIGKAEMDELDEIVEHERRYTELMDEKELITLAQGQNDEYWKKIGEQEMEELDIIVDQEDMDRSTNNEGDEDVKEKQIWMWIAEEEKDEIKTITEQETTCGEDTEVDDNMEGNDEDVSQDNAEERREANREIDIEMYGTNDEVQVEDTHKNIEERNGNYDEKSQEENEPSDENEEEEYLDQHEETPRQDEEEQSLHANEEENSDEKETQENIDFDSGSTAIDIVTENIDEEEQSDESKSDVIIGGY